MTQVCQAAAAGFAFLMVALQLKIWTSGTIQSHTYDLFDQSVQSLWWLITAGVLLRVELSRQKRWAFIAGLTLLGLATLQILFGHALANNPLLSGQPVGTVPLLNVLLLAFGAPALVIWGIASLPGFVLPDRVRDVGRLLPGLLVFLNLSLEVRRAFWGSQIMLEGQPPQPAEVYAYSAAWIAYALALLAIGILQRASIWRYVSRAVLIVTVLKVFLYDMSDLTGLYRVASFLGLGLSLIGIGQVYRRFVFRA